MDYYQEISELMCLVLFSTGFSFELLVCGVDFSFWKDFSSSIALKDFVQRIGGEKVKGRMPTEKVTYQWPLCAASYSRGFI